MKRIFGLVVLIALVAVVGNAQIGLKAVGGEVGYASYSFSGGGSSQTLGGFLVGGVANLGELAPALTLYPSVTYSSAKKDISGATVKVGDFAINGNVKYSFKGEGFTPYVGGGIGLNFVSSTVTVPYFGEVTGSDTKIGINLLGGAEFKMSKMTGFVQAGYVIISDVNHLQIVAGVMFPMN